MGEALGMSVAAWSPLAHGVLSGKFTRPGSAEGALSSRDQAAARAAQDVADELGVTAAQVAIAWTCARSRAVHPILGASSAEQLADNLGAVDVVLPGDAIQRLASAVEFSRGFPTDFIAECETTPWVFGEAATRLDGRS